MPWHSCYCKPIAAQRDENNVLFYKVEHHVFISRIYDICHDSDMTKVGR